MHISFLVECIFAARKRNPSWARTAAQVTCKSRPSATVGQHNTPNGAHTAQNWAMERNNNLTVICLRLHVAPSILTRSICTSTYPGDICGRILENTLHHHPFRWWYHDVMFLRRQICQRNTRPPGADRYHPLTASVDSCSTGWSWSDGLNGASGSNSSN